MLATPPPTPVVIKQFLTPLAVIKQFITAAGREQLLDHRGIGEKLLDHRGIGEQLLDHERVCEGLPVVTTGATRSAGRAGEVRGEVARFALTGLVAYGVDVVVFNLCLLGVGTGPVAAKVISSVFAITVAFLGSRFYTWRHRPRGHAGREYALFFSFSVLAALIQVACLVISNDLLGLDGAIADNVSGNVVGMGLATAFRFWSFRRYVFTDTQAANT